jgi:hypothetical protein
MTLGMIDTVWSAMRKDEFYSVRDLANALEEPTEAVVQVMEFLSRYGFAHRVTKHELIFRKAENAPSPGDALRVLRVVLADASASGDRVPNVSKTPGRFDQSRQSRYREE